jgi:hypothetical protein
LTQPAPEPIYPSTKNKYALIASGLLAGSVLVTEALVPTESAEPRLAGGDTMYVPRTGLIAVVAGYPRTPRPSKPAADRGNGGRNWHHFWQRFASSWLVGRHPATTRRGDR